MQIDAVKEHEYDSVVFQAVDPFDGTTRKDTFYLDELGWSWERQSDMASLHAFCQSILDKWAQIMEVTEAKYVLE